MIRNQTYVTSFSLNHKTLPILGNQGTCARQEGLVLPTSLYHAKHNTKLNIYQNHNREEASYQEKKILSARSSTSWTEVHRKLDFILKPHAFFYFHRIVLRIVRGGRSHHATKWRLNLLLQVIDFNHAPHGFSPVEIGIQLNCTSQLLAFLE